MRFAGVSGLCYTARRKLGVELFGPTAKARHNRFVQTSRERLGVGGGADSPADKQDRVYNGTPEKSQARLSQPAGSAKTGRPAQAASRVLESE